MRFSAITIAVASLLVVGVASAAPGKGERGAGGPSAGSSGDGGRGGEPGGLASRDYAGPDRTDDVKKGDAKAWEAEVAWETHHLIRQEDLNNAGENKTFNYLDAYFQYDVTRNDRLRLRGG